MTTGAVVKMHRILKRVGSMCLFKFAVHPHSFAETIENFFHLAFLVKQGDAEVYIDETGLPMVGMRKSLVNAFYNSRT